MLRVSALCFCVCVHIYNLSIKTQISPAGDTALPLICRWFLEGFLRSEGNITESPSSYFRLKAGHSDFAVF